MENRFPFSSRIYLVTAMLILAAGLMVSFFYVRNNSKRPGYSSSPSVSAEIIPSIEVVRSVLLAKAQIKFPNIISSSAISVSQLPKDLNTFLFNDAKDIKAKALYYDDKTKGYAIDYVLDTPWRDTHYRFLGLAYPADSALWKQLSARQTSLFSVVEL